MMRYADDLALFFHTKRDAYEGQKLVIRLLDRLKLTIPSIGSPKTSLVGPSDPLSFPWPGNSSHKRRVICRRSVAATNTQHLEDEYSLTNCQKSNINFQKALTNLSKSVDAYRGSYRDAHNFIVLDQELKHANRKVVSNIFADIFGPGALELLRSHHKKFLGF
jgi:RNA-directed DNA polymerase